MIIWIAGLKLDMNHQFVTAEYTCCTQYQNIQAVYMNYAHIWSGYFLYGNENISTINGLIAWTGG